jgi:hypothetical protein
MMNSTIGPFLKLGELMWNLFLSAIGCFVFMRCFRLVALGKENSETVASISVAGTTHKSWAGIGAAFPLLAFATSEPLPIIHAHRH